ncbi:hypothetical protein FOA52_014220 [Chlamydomonas sp. UWO 241]|nr:hypothetical protein FOA52_014220 [Chlamydomonas sp. UWO 241]
MVRRGDARRARHARPPRTGALLLVLLSLALLASTCHAHGHGSRTQRSTITAGHWHSMPQTDEAPTSLVGSAVVAPAPEHHSSRALLQTCSAWKWSWVTSSYVSIGATAACTKLDGSACVFTCHDQCCPDDGHCVGTCTANLVCTSTGAGSVAAQTECPMVGHYAYCDFAQYSLDGSRVLGRVRCNNGAGSLTACAAAIRQYEGADCTRDGTQHNFRLCSTLGAECDTGTPSSSSSIPSSNPP